MVGSQQMKTCICPRSVKACQEVKCENYVFFLLLVVVCIINSYLRKIYRSLLLSGNVETSGKKCKVKRPELQSK